MCPHCILHLLPFLPLFATVLAAIGTLLRFRAAPTRKGASSHDQHNSQRNH